MDKNLLIMEHPEVHCPGNVEVIIPESSRSKIEEIQKDRKERLYFGRAYLSSIYDNTRPDDQILKFSGATLIKMTEKELRSYLNWQSSGVVFTFEDVLEAFRELRNGIVHFLMEESKGAMIMPSRGLDRSAIEKEDQILRICNQKMIEPLWDYFNKYLTNEYNRSKILVDNSRPKDFPAC